jgi:ubiquinone/menaquinone biosynthesis C-methylase UbiE
MPINTHFNLLAPYYDRAVGPPDAEQMRALLRLPVAGWLLDAGGGTGRVSAQLNAWVDHVVISDLSQPMLRQAQDKGDLRPVQAQVQRLPFPDNWFDRILVVDAMHHFGDQRTAIQDLVRVLKPGGRLVIQEPDINTNAVKVVALAEKLALMGSHFHTPAELRDLVASHGLPARIEHNGGFSVWVVADK